jgi:hypothetical protein
MIDNMKKLIFGVLGIGVLIATVWMLVNLEIYLFFPAVLFITPLQATGIVVAMLALKLMIDLYMPISNSRKVEDLQKMYTEQMEINIGHLIVLASLIEYNGGIIRLPSYFVSRMLTGNKYQNIEYNEKDGMILYTFKGADEENAESKIS